MKKFITPEKCLVIMPDFIGDNVILLSFLENLKKNMNKNSELIILSHQNMIEFFKDFDFIDKIFEKKEKTKHPAQFLISNKIDTIIVLDFSIVWSIAAYFARIKQRIIPSLLRSGLKNSKFLQKFFTHVIKNTSINAKISQKDVYLNYLKQLGMNIFNKTCSYPEKKTTLHIKKLKPSAFIHTSASFFSKKWPLENWEKVLEFLNDKFEITYIGEKNKKENILSDKFKLNDLRGSLSIKDTLNLLQNADLLLTTDSAPAHLGALAGTKNIIIIYGPTNHIQWKPDAEKSNIIQIYSELPCRPCQMRFCRSLECIRQISPERIINEIKSNKDFFQSLSTYD